MKSFSIELEYDLLINGEPAKIELFDADNFEYSMMEIYLTDFKSVKDLPLLQKIIWIFFDKFTNAHPWGGFPAYYLRIGIDELADVFKVEMDDVEAAVNSLIEKKRLLTFEQEDKVLAYAAI